MVADPAQPTYILSKAMNSATRLQHLEFSAAAPMVSSLAAL